MTTSVLITGASGLIGSRLTKIFLQKGYQVSHLGRTVRHGTVPSFIWNIEEGKMDPLALTSADAIVHLAGAGVADKRWTMTRKRTILESRTKSTELLYQYLKSNKHHVKTFVSASAIGYYGFGMDDELRTEESPPGNDYLAQVVVAWEAAVDRIASLGIRVVKIRIGIVLSEKGGALSAMLRPVRIGIGSPLGSGKQMVSWIHITDLCAVIARALEDESWYGAFNAAAPNPVTNRELTVAIANVLHRPLWLPHVPAFALRWALGEMADVVLNGRSVSSKKLENAGFVFQFKRQQDALEDLLGRDQKINKSPRQSWNQPVHSKETNGH